MPKDRAELQALLELLVMDVPRCMGAPLSPRATIALAGIVVVLVAAKLALSAAGLDTQAAATLPGVVLLPAEPAAAAAASASSSSPTLVRASQLAFSGRTSALSSVVDGAAFDWEGAAVRFSFSRARFVSAVVRRGPAASADLATLMQAFVRPRKPSAAPLAGGGGWTNAIGFIVDGKSGAGANDTYLAAADLDPAVDYELRVMNVLEPHFAHVVGPDDYFLFAGIVLPPGAVALPPAPPNPRRIEVIGDSISAGHGAFGDSTHCRSDPSNSGVTGTWGHAVCEALDAECSWAAYSGKGVFNNCCDDGELMPSFWRKARAGEAAGAETWAPARFVPSLVLFNLGTNDWSKHLGREWELGFSDAVVTFLLDVADAYKFSALPVFLAQGPMNSLDSLNDALVAAAAEINARGGVATYVDLRGLPNDGCSGHPGVSGHAKMAAITLAAVKAKMGW